MDKNFMYGNCPTSTQTLLFNEIILGRTEVYDTTKHNCWAFCKSTDIRNGKLSVWVICVVAILFHFVVISSEVVNVHISVGSFLWMHL